MKPEEANVIGVGYIGSLISLHIADQSKNVNALDKKKGILNKKEWFKRYNDIEKEIEKSQLENIETITDYSKAKADVSIVCVNTPSKDSSADLSNLKESFKELAENISREETIILRSTVPPKTCNSILIPIIEEVSGLERGTDFHFGYAPEFVRGGTGLKEFRDPSKTVISGDEKAKKVFKDLFPVSENLHETSIETAEAVKYFDNAFHGLKISLANECGRLGEEIGLDAKKVMEVISSDYKLNMSDMYMTPGKSFGGPCLTKDIQVLENEAEKNNTETPVISSINESNDQHNSWIVQKILDKQPDSVGIIGATYKEGFNSVVNSPALNVANDLRDRVGEVMIYDPKIEIEEFKQVGKQKVRETDILIIFNQIDNLEELKTSFNGDIVDLADFSF
jgi:GDP-mannose 6-dehydrogenase